MNDIRKTEIRVGVLTILGIIGFLLIFGWAKDIQLFGEDQLIKIQFNSVAGLEEGDRVTVHGIRKGYVEKIELIDNEVIVTAMVDSDTKLYSDAQFSIVMLDMMGGKKIEIDPGKKGEVMDIKKLQHGKFVGDLATAMEVFGEVQDDLLDIITETKKSIASINTLLSDNELRNDIKGSVSNLSRLSKKLNVIVDSNKEELNQLIKNGNQLAESANKLIIENSENINETVAEMREVVNNSNNLIKRLNKLAEEVENKENNIGKLLYDEQLADDLKVTISQVKTLTEILIEQLKNEGVNVDAHIF